MRGAHRELFTEFGPPPEDVRCRFRREHAGGPIHEAEFDWETVYRELDGESDMTIDHVAAAAAMCDMIDWIEEPWRVDGRDVKTERMVRFKLTVLRLILRPSTLNGATLTELAARLGTSRQMLSRLACDFRDRFGVCSRWMASAEAREAYQAGKMPQDGTK